MLSIANMTKMSQAFTLLQKVKQDLKLNPEEITILNTISVSYNNGKITINEKFRRNLTHFREQFPAATMAEPKTWVRTDGKPRLAYTIE